MATNVYVFGFDKVIFGFLKVSIKVPSCTSSLHLLWRQVDAFHILTTLLLAKLFCEGNRVGSWKIIIVSAIIKKYILTLKVSLEAYISPLSLKSWQKPCKEQGKNEKLVMSQNLSFESLISYPKNQCYVVLPDVSRFSLPPLKYFRFVRIHGFHQFHFFHGSNGLILIGISRWGSEASKKIVKCIWGNLGFYPTNVVSTWWIITE